MPKIRFVFDKETLNSFKDCLDENDNLSYMKGLNSIDYLLNNYKDVNEGSDDIFICVHDSNRFFSLLEELVNIDTKDRHLILFDSYDILLGLWLRMGLCDIENIERFLERQVMFMKNYEFMPKYSKCLDDNNKKVLTCTFNENSEWFETNKNIVFYINESQDNLLEELSYFFPSIHFGISRENNKLKCFIYGIQSNDDFSCEKIQKELQPIRKIFRNKYVSADFIIALSLFLDYLYDIGIKYVEVPSLQVFNYPYHENLSINIKRSFDSYSDSDKEELEHLNDVGDNSDKVLDYLHTKRMVSKFVDKQDLISYNKTERLIYTFLELIKHNDSIKILSEPYGQSDNMIIYIGGKSNILDDYNKNIAKVFCNKKNK